MKEKILEISNKLRNDEITEKEAKRQFLFLFDVSVPLSIEQGIEICGRWEQHLHHTDNEDIGYISKQIEIVKTVLNNER